MDLKKIQIALDVIVLFLVLAGAVYIYMNWSWLHNAVDDPCKVCMDKTGGVCMKNPIVTSNTIHINKTSYSDLFNGS